MQEIRKPIILFLVLIGIILLISGKAASDVKEGLTEQSRKMGVGIITGPFYRMNAFARSERRPYDDSIAVYDRTRVHKIGFIPVLGESVYTYETEVTIDGSTIKYYNADLDRLDGMFSWENSFKVFQKDGDWLNIFVGRYGYNTTWVRLSDFGKMVSFTSWMDYFKKFPMGNADWQRGYDWLGKGTMNLQYYPYEGGKIKQEIGGGVEIYLTGEFVNSWARVRVKEVSYIYGENYLEGSKYGNESEGWIRIVSKEGYPFLNQIILGC
jgi:hypothetical protein